MTADLIIRARSGDGDAFREVTEPYRRELQVHCYRMLGSFQDAEDALQDTLLTPGKGWPGSRGAPRSAPGSTGSPPTGASTRFARRAGARPWRGISPGWNRPSRPGSAEVAWLEPFPDALLAGAIDIPAGPEARYEQTEAISLAFVTALQVLPARQLAVLILRDVLGYHASEVADMLDSTLESVNSALKRARASLQRRLPPAGEREPAPAPDSPAEQALAATFARAYSAGDIDALVALLTNDVLVSMPPVPLEWQGRDAVTRFYASIFGQGRAYELVPTRANGQPAFGAYLVAHRHPPQRRPAGPHLHRRPDLRHHPLRQQRAAMVRAAAIAPRLSRAIPPSWPRRR